MENVKSGKKNMLEWRHVQNTMRLQQKLSALPWVHGKENFAKTLAFELDLEEMEI